MGFWKFKPTCALESIKLPCDAGFCRSGSTTVATGDFSGVAGAWNPHICRMDGLDSREAWRPAVVLGYWADVDVGEDDIHGADLLSM